MASQESPSPDLSVADRLDHEIATLRSQVESLQKELKLHTTNLLAADSTREILQEAGKKSAGVADKLTGPLAQSDQQIAHKQQCLYRACASITALKIRDPDPNAVDGGNVLGLRLDVMSRTRFTRPYYVMLNRPYPDSRHLRVHRHTVPPCIPLSGLAARHLPAPKSGDDGEPGTQDLARFSRALRRELVRYHNRNATIADLRTAAGLESRKGKRKESDTAIANISAADAEAKQIRVEWIDGRAGRIVLSDDGDILKAVVQGERGRDRDTVQQFLGGVSRVEELTKRLGGG